MLAGLTLIRLSDPINITSKKLVGRLNFALSIGQYSGEGIDLDNLECLFIVYPFAFEGKLIQYIGRIQRSGKPPVIFDYRDSKIDYFDKMFKQRNRYYNKLLR